MLYFPPTILGTRSGVGYLIVYCGLVGYSALWVAVNGSGDTKKQRPVGRDGRGADRGTGSGVLQTPDGLRGTPAQRLQTRRFRQTSSSLWTFKNFIL